MAVVGREPSHAALVRKHAAADEGFVAAGVPPQLEMEAFIC